jgi:hypothetical protein
MRDGMYIVKPMIESFLKLEIEFNLQPESGDEAKLSKSCGFQTVEIAFSVSDHRGIVTLVYDDLSRLARSCEEGMPWRVEGKACGSTRSQMMLGSHDRFIPC